MRSAGSAADLAHDRIDALRLELDARPLGPFPDTARRLYWFAPPPTTGDRDSRLRAALEALQTRPPERVLYLSTSAVYGDCGGAWIDEDAPLAPGHDRGRRRLDAERALADFSARSGCSTVILRVPGIYGPGRLPRERLARGLPVVRESECPWTNRIHADDLARIAVEAMSRAPDGAIYNVSDGHPTTMTDYFLRCARLLGLPEPEQIPLADAHTRLTPAMASFLDESKRLLTTRLQRELPVTLRYPDLAHGLPSCVDGT
ncbi:MAG: family oxidoreductase [Panacagrimonas sp.]|nr:NAD-dependent epimerase/dehydratase family protein [Panacagrimonas sp.]MCC2656831.1 family oxidoreductase [Panacagrimonas sp.]